MKKILLFSGIAVLILSTACNNNPKEEAHEHEDGSIHAHADTVKPVQQEFKVTNPLNGDTTAHMHKDGEKHGH